MKFILILLSFSCMALAHAQDISYSALTIPDSLKKNANAVYRLDEGIVDISSPSHYTYKVHQVVTVLNAEGAQHFRHVIGFDKFKDVDNVQLTIYNALGLQEKKYTKKDFTVQAAYDGISLVTDDKVMRLITSASAFPCTIDFRYTMDINAYLELPDWLLSNHKESVETFRLIVSVPPDLDIRYRSVNCNLQPVIEQSDKKKKYTWEAKNIVATKYQTDGYGLSHYLPRVEIAPNAFEYDGYKGQFRNWSDFGKWNYALYEERTPFTKQRIDEIKELVRSVQGVNEKVKVLYDYMQRNVRYVSIQLGIGGFKPFAAKFVDEKKYGDCKALSNYMRNLLLLADIPSYPALINAGYDEPPVDPAFPSSVFNHVILCVPNKNDTIWLECTSRNNAPGFLGSFTENKNALLLTENGGILVRTPASRKENNKLNSHTEISLKEDGSAYAKVSLSSSGDILSMFRAIKKMNRDDQKEIFLHNLHYAPPDVFLMEDDKDDSQKDIVSLHFEFDKLHAFKAGSKYFFPQKLSKLNNEQLKDEPRTAEYVFDYPFEKTDTTVYSLPKKFTADELPPNKDVQNELGYYKKQVEFDKASGKIQIVTTLAIKKNIILPGDYKKLVEFFNVVQLDEEEKLILKEQ